MRKFLIRKEWRSTCYEYELEITPQLIQDCEEYVNANYKFTEDKYFKLTSKDLIDAWNDFYDDGTPYEGILNLKVVEGYFYSNGKYRNYLRGPIMLGEAVKDYLNDVIWDQPYTESDSSCEGISDGYDEYDEI